MKTFGGFLQVHQIRRRLTLLRQGVIHVHTGFNARIILRLDFESAPVLNELLRRSCMGVAIEVGWERLCRKRFAQRIWKGLSRSGRIGSTGTTGKSG
jgi:hypothetical protein